MVDLQANDRGRHRDRAPRTQRRCHYRRLVETSDMLVHEILCRNFLPHTPAAKTVSFFQSEHCEVIRRHDEGSAVAVGAAHG